MDSHNMDDAAPPEAPPRFSRYRSVRRAHAQQAQIDAQQAPPVPTLPPVPPMPALPTQREQEAPVSRSMSRYHRRPTLSHATAAKGPPLRSATIDVPPLASTQASAAVRNRAQSSPQARLASNVQPRVPSASRARDAASATPPGSRPRPRNARDEAKQLLQDENDRQRRLREKLEAEKRERIKAEQARQAELERQEQQRIDDEAELLRAQREADEAEQLRQQQQQEDKERGKRLQKAESSKRLQEREDTERRIRAEEATRRAQASPPVSPPRHGGFTIFKRRNDGAQSPPEALPTSKPHQTSYGNRDMDTIRPGGGGAVLGIDAPMSAVNAGDRRVTVVCNKKAFFLPVTPETTVQDLLKSAALCMTEPINVTSDILVESFRKVGLRRPLRLYEHVRDIMNSWDSDEQNDLEISCPTAEVKNWSHDTLVASKVPDAKPEGMSCFIQYSSKPGKWSKRYITLRPDGLLVMARNEAGKDQENICHISDFDIYTPTKRKREKIKPPKKNCWAVKSQQKSNIFSDETRYVHFFSTADETTASQFYEAIQVWRSWHLKHVMGEGQKKAPDTKAANGAMANGKPQGEMGSGESGSHTRNTSVSSYYQLGSFKPLFDLESFGKDLDSAGSSRDLSSQARADTHAMHARKMSTRVKNPPPAAFSRGGLVTEPALPATDRTESSPQGIGFASTSLLGEEYARKQRELQEREKQAGGPFTEGPSLINSMDHMARTAGNEGSLGRRSSVRSNNVRSSSDMQRSLSTRMKPRPLVDLTPQYREPPQHRNKGKGFAPEAGTGPLIENATSIEEAIKLPSSNDWRARAGGRTHGTYGTGGHERTRSFRGRGDGLAAYTVNNHAGAPVDEGNAFTGGGLVARAGFSQGDRPVGHGVMDGSKARGPMLDMRDNSQFVSGSLLATVEQRQGAGRPVTSRDKRQSVDLG